MAWLADIRGSRGCFCRMPLFSSLQCEGKKPQGAGHSKATRARQAALWDGCPERGWVMGVKEFAQFNQQWNQLTMCFSSPTLYFCECRHKKNVRTQQNLPLYFLKSGSAIFCISEHLLSWWNTHNVLWPHALSWSERLCIYEDAALGLYYISFPSSYCQKELEVLRMFFALIYIKQDNIVFFLMFLNLKKCQMRTTVLQQSPVVSLTYLDTSVRGQNPLTRRDSCTQRSGWPTCCSTLISWRHQTATGSKRNMRWKFQWYVKCYF